MTSHSFSRRRALALLGGGVVCSGCLGRSALSPPPLAIGETQTTGNVSVTVENARVEKTIAGNHMLQSIAVGDGQFLVADVTTGGFADDVPEFAAVTGRSRSPVDDDPTTTTKTVIHQSGADTGTFRTRQLVFSIPTKRFDRVAVAWTRTFPVYWDVGDGVLDALAHAPSFEVSNFTVTHDNDASVMTLDVTNSGDRDGTFRAAVSQSNVHDDSDLVESVVPMGETVHHRSKPEILQRLEDGQDAEVTLNYGTGSVQTEIEW